MTNKSTTDDKTAKERRVAPRARTFLKGVVYYDNRNASIDCTIRDLSDTGARITFTTMVTVPDNIELHIPQKQRVLLARVLRREPHEIGVSFEDQRSNEPRRAIDSDMAARRNPANISAIEIRETLNFW